MDDVSLWCDVIAERYKNIYGTGKDKVKTHDPSQMATNKYELTQHDQEILQAHKLNEQTAFGEDIAIPEGKRETEADANRVRVAKRQGVLVGLMRVFGVKEEIIQNARKEAYERIQQGKIPNVPSEEEIVRITNEGTREEFRELMKTIRESRKHSVNVDMHLR